MSGISLLFYQWICILRQDVSLCRFVSLCTAMKRILTLYLSYPFHPLLHLYICLHASSSTREIIHDLRFWSIEFLN